MTDQNNQEPTMEEILASIRRIISEDDPPAGAAAEAPAEVPAVAAPAPIEAFEEEDEVLELTDRVEPEPAPAPAPLESMGDLDVFPTESPAPEPSPPPVASSFDGESLIGAPAASSAASAFASLTQTISMPRDGRNLEDVVRELLRPLMKQWLDENLPRIVEDAVRTEVERIARRHG